MYVSIYMEKLQFIECREELIHFKIVPMSFMLKTEKY